MAAGGLLVFAGLLTYGGFLVTEMVSSHAGFTGVIAGVVLNYCCGIGFQIWRMCFSCTKRSNGV